ncbi:hypothetical protein [Leisingera sp.]|uniref:hypothetical protein n=1 Tax=Leisingera sp. TaxID=1879318 RepID=UPI002B26FAD7|nr:hypothetical protein [Leisingera sp.]
MISTHSVKAGRKTHKLKASMRAQVRLEEETGQPIGEILNQLLSGSGGVKLVSQAWAAFLDDGAGVELDDALDLLDALGGANSAGEHLAKTLQNAFPFLRDEEPEGNEPGEGDAGNAESPAA